MIKVILVDDEQPALDELEHLLACCGDVETIAKTTDPFEALRLIDTLRPDAVFLDIDMPIVNGISLAMEIAAHKANLPIIFVTAYNEYALQAFDVNAVDYIVKPVRAVRLEQTVKKLRSITAGGLADDTHMMDKLTVIKDTVNNEPERIIVFDGNDYNFICPDEITYIEAQKKHTVVFTTGNAYTAKKSMDVWEKRLADLGFFRCHRSYIINPVQITKITPTQNGAYLLKMVNSSVYVPVSKPHVKKIRQMIQENE